MKKLLSITLSAATILSLLSGCGGGTASAPAQSQASGTSASEGNGIVTLRMVYKDISPDDPTSVRFIEELNKGMQAEGINAQIELVPIQSGTYSEKLGLLLNTGDIPDIIYFQGGDYAFGVTQGILEDLRPYVEKSPNIKAALEPYAFTRMENYPYLMYFNPASYKVPVIREDWFAELETGPALEADPTPENYYNFFKELKEKKGLTAAYTVAGDLSEIDNVFDQAFGLTQTWLKGEDGKYVFGRVTEFEKNKLEYYAKLYADGLLDNEYLTKQWDTKEKAFYDGDVGVISGTQGAVIDTYEKKQRIQNGEGAALRVLPPAKGIAQGYTPIDVSKESRGIAVSKFSEHKDLAVQVFDYALSQKGQMLCKLGFEGEHYNIENGQIVRTDKAAEWFAKFYESPKTFEPDPPLSPETPYWGETATKSLEIFSQYATEDNLFLMPEELATKWDACTAAYKEFTADVITGNKSIDEFDAFVENWYALGGQEITDYANTVLA